MTYGYYKSNIYLYIYTVTVIVGLSEHLGSSFKILLPQIRILNNRYKYLQIANNLTI